MTEENRGAEDIGWCVSALRVANRGLTLLFYGAYGALLVLAGFQHPFWLVPLAGVPAVAFVLVSLVRRRLNAPRPYDNGGPAPLIPREGDGCSFPSRHAFSAFAIAGCWCAQSVPVALALMACAAALSWCRVLGGVHFPRDVVAGAFVGLATGLAAWACVLALG